MTPEELTRLRYKRTTRFPFCNEDVSIYGETFAIKGELFYCKDYPDLFQEMQWYEERKSEDMPEYVKWNYNKDIDNTEMNGLVRKVEGWHQKGFSVIVQGQIIASRHFLPATREEYEACQLKIQQP
jgi:hypothetical protein